MPCPYFEPQRVASVPQHPNARMPLLDEYDGLCHAEMAVTASPAELRFRCCNHGYSRGCCERFPADEIPSGFRYTVVRRNTGTLEILCVQEQEYAPVRWRSVEYSIETGYLEPELPDACMRAQLIAFCRSYLKRCSD